MAVITQYVDYVVYFRDQAEFDLAVDASGGTSFPKNPADTAAFFGITFPPTPGPLDGDKGIYPVINKYLFTEPGTPVAELDVLANQLKFLSPSADSVTSTCSSPGGGWPPSPDVRFVWSCSLQKVGGSAGADPAPLANIPQRRWIGGDEISLFGEGGLSGINVAAASRDSSRTIDGIGLPIRGTDISNTWSRNVNEFQAGFTTTSSWERIYTRIRVAPSASYRFWRCRGSVSANAGVGLKINTDRTITLVNIDAADAETILGTSVSVLVVDQWYLFDIVFGFAGGTLMPSKVQLYVNHSLVFDFTVGGGQGLNSAQNHASSALGQAGTANAVIEMDFDDWICADIPTFGSAVSLTSIDWLTGSHVRKHYVTAFGALNANWAGSFMSMNQDNNPDQALNSSLTSSTSGAILDGITDVTDEQDSIGQALGIVSFVVALYSSNAGGTDGTLGYSIAGAAPVMATIDQGVAAQYNSIMYRPSGLNLPTSVVPLRILHNKSADANLTTVTGLQVAVEYIGTWGLEDDPNGPDIPRIGLLHNCNYGNTTWSFIGPASAAPVQAVGGTYTGNGTAQNINLPGPCHFLWIRPLTGGSLGMRWFGAALGGHQGTTQRIIPNYPVRVFVDSTGQAKFSVAGTDSQINQNAIVYQYIAFCDPGMRYNLCGALKHPNALAAAVNNLIATSFLPLAGFVQNDVLGINSGVQALSYKGPGHGANDGNEVAGTVIANWGSFAAGVFNTRSGIHYNTAGQINYSLWRPSDDCNYTMLQILSYTGNGAGARTITLTPTSNRFPLFAYVQPHNAVGFYRDPSHTGANSCNASTLVDSVNGITAGGIDSITVAAALNAGGVVYDVFVICGDTAGWNNGSFSPPPCLSPTGPYPPPNGPGPGDNDISVFADGGLILDGTPSLTMLASVSGIYTLVPGKTHDTLYDRQPGVTSVNVKIPDPFAKGGYVGG
jgi:hypothetical protein